MKVVKTIAEFYTYNHGELRALACSMYTFQCEQDLEDKLQDFYLVIQQQHTLQRFDPTRGASFETWVCNALSWCLMNKHYRRQLATMIPYNERIHTSSIDPASRVELQHRIRYFQKYLHNTKSTHLLGILEQISRKLNDKTYSDTYAAQLLHKYCKDFNKLD